MAAVHLLTKLPNEWLFWAAYVLTRPLGATLGDTLTKSHSERGRIASSLMIAAAMVIIIALSTRHRDPIRPA